MAINPILSVSERRADPSVRTGVGATRLAKRCCLASVERFDEFASASGRSARLMKETLNMPGRFVRPGMCGTSLRCSGSITNGLQPRQ